MNKSLILIAVLVVLVLGGYYFYQNKMVAQDLNSEMGTQTPIPVASTSPESTDSGDTMTTGTVKEFIVLSNGPNYDLKEIKVKEGDTVKITFKNNLGSHNLLIDEFNVKYDPIGAGQTKIVEFVANKKGSFKYYCGVANHRQLGQEGTLIVE